MISKNEVQYIQSLSHKKNREATGLFIAETPKLVKELLAARFVIKKLYATKAFLTALPANISAPVVELTLPQLQRISNLQTPHDVLAVVEQKKLSQTIPPANKLSIMLDGVQNPGNVGAIIRIADWFGIDTIIAATDTADVYNPKVVQATMGSITRVNVYYKNLPEVLKQTQLPVYGALLQGKSIYEIDKITEGIIIIGSEARGIRDEVLPFITQPVTIPKFGNAESLNAAVAAGIIISHLKYW